MPAPQPRPALLAIDLYVPGKSKGTGTGPLYKLSSNETPLGPSPAALAAFREAADALDLYPDGAATALREAIAGRYGLDPARIVCGCGSDDLLHLLAQAYLGPGDEAIVTEHGFLVYTIAARAAGATVVAAPERDRTADVDAILARVSERTRIVFIANPNNPTGTYLPFDAVKRLRAGLPDSVLLVLDAAYAEYVRANDYSSGLELSATLDNVVMTRTFSKIHGLASLRIGWCYGPAAVCDALNRIRGPFTVNGPGLAAGIAAIRDAAHLDAAAAHNVRWLGWVTEQLTRLGLAVTPSVANFVLVTFPAEPGRGAGDADAFLSARNIVVRGVSAYGLPDCLRITIGTEEANRALVAGLADFVAGAP